MTPPLIALAGVSVVMTVMTLLVGILYFLKAVSRRQAVSAADAAVGRPVVVRRINVLRPASQENWSRVGRIDLLRSHRVDPKR
jgi:Na+-transporting methylmalonyl-CoA/oxaloacetate decarboxylase gamma subunit